MQDEQGFSFKSLFVPFTTFKAIQWIIVIGVIVYFNSLFNGFVWDDEGQILNNTFVHSLSNIPLLFHNGTFIVGINQLSSNYYKPLLSIVFTLLYSLAGPHAFLFHSFQLSLHIFNAILLFFLLKYFLERKVAFILSVVFLVHPVNVEAVSYISALQEPLFFFFGISSLLIIVYQKLQIKSLFLISILLLLSTLSKETGFLFFIASFSFIFLYKKIRTVFIFSLISIIDLVIYLYLRFSLAGVHLTDQHLAPISRAHLITRLYTIPNIIFYYIKDFFFPFHLTVSQDWVTYSISFTNFYLPLIIDAIFFSCIIAIGIYIFNRKKTFFKSFMFFSVWLLIGFGLHSQIIPLDMTAADRWFYFPIVGLLGIIGILSSVLHINWKNKWMISCILLLIALLAVGTIVRNIYWESDQTIFLHDVKINTTSYMLENNAGIAYFKMGDLKQAQYYFLRSSKLAPYFWTDWFDLGVLAEKQNRRNAAITYYKKSITTGNYEGAYLNLAILYVKEHNYKYARETSLNGLKLFPKDVSLWLTLATSEYQLGNYSQALKDVRQAHRLVQNDNTDYFLHIISKKLPLDLNFGK